MAVEEVLDDLFILVGEHGAGGVEEFPLWPYKLARRVEDFSLIFYKRCDSFSDSPPKLRVSSPHTSAGARRIDKDLVESLGGVIAHLDLRTPPLGATPELIEGARTDVVGGDLGAEGC